MLTPRERIMATLKGQQTDQLPYIPRLDLWYKANKKRGTLPTKYHKASLMEIVDDLELGYHSIIPDFQDYNDPLDDVDRALGFYRLNKLPYRTILNGVKRNVSYEGDLTIAEYLTPLGSVKTKVLYNDRMRRDGITISHVAEHAIKQTADYEKVAYIFDNAEVEATYDKYIEHKETIGDRGEAVALISINGSPMHHIQRELMPYDLFFYEYYEHPEELASLAASIEKYYKKVIEVAVECPANIFLLGANYDRQVTWPPYFEKHIAPNLANAADIVHQKGKYLLTHTDGENKGLLEAYVASNIDIADSICPAPMTSLTLKQTRDVFQDRITIWGGIPSITVLEKSMSDYDFEAYIECMMEEIGTGAHLILSIADTTPPDAKFSRIVKLAEVAKQFRPVVEK